MRSPRGKGGLDPTSGAVAAAHPASVELTLTADAPVVEHPGTARAPCVDGACTAIAHSARVDLTGGTAVAIGVQRSPAARAPRVHCALAAFSISAGEAVAIIGVHAEPAPKIALALTAGGIPRRHTGPMAGAPLFCARIGVVTLGTRTRAELHRARREGGVAVCPRRPVGPQAADVSRHGAPFGISFGATALAPGPGSPVFWARARERTAAGSGGRARPGIA